MSREEKKNPGTVYLVGAGPGAEDLITLRGAELLAGADCVVYDALVNAQLLNRCKDGCEIIYVGKRAGQHTSEQEQINGLLAEKARQHRCVVRLKGGDPFIFGRGGEEMLALADAGIPCEMVPGVSSALAAPACAGIPVTHRGVADRLTITTGHGAAGERQGRDAVQQAIDPTEFGTEVVLMGMDRVDEVTRRLMDGGQPGDTPAAVIQWATTARQRCLYATLETLAVSARQAGIGAPAVIVVGRAVRLAAHLLPRVKKPLAGLRIAITRAREQAGLLMRKLQEFGAETVLLPTLRLVAPAEKRHFAESVVGARHYDWLVFSSPNGVEKFFEAFFSVYEDLREIGGARIAALGPGTAAALRKRGVMTDVVPQEAVAEKLIAEFDRRADDFGGLEHTTMLWVHAQQARPYIREELLRRRAIVDECVAYDVRPGSTQLAQALLAPGADIIVFTSSSTVRHFVQMGLSLPDACRVASMGPVTTRSLRAAGLPVHIEAPLHTIESLVQAIVQQEGEQTT